MITGFKESDVKQAIRELLFDACNELGRTALTYLGMPSSEARDIRVLAPLLENVICIDDERIPGTLDALGTELASLSLKQRRLVKGDMWSYLRDEYPGEPLVADVAFLDFCGGGIRNENPFSVELAGLRAYFAKQARHDGRAFVVAWTYMPRDSGRDAYVDVCEKLNIEATLLEQLKSSVGVRTRSIAVRLLLYQCIREHSMRATLYQHSMYKGTMNTVLVLFGAVGARTGLGDPATLLSEPVVVYEPGKPTPRLEALLEV